MKQVPFDQLTYARFIALVKTRFRVQADAANRIELELTAATRFQTRLQPNKEGTAQKNDSFSLTFSGPASRCLEQKTYQFEHDELGIFCLFIVPIGKTPDAFQYEAVFNRLD